ncbi:phage putative head morphogenesis protein, SPP1 gp7 family [Desulfosporosinus youngiae DSM 17734]|uniref:Phage putative head morphogenesis protein, SPP1 gp7 family n=1 Tax=Desulfosporosinus youngiae DSM 17734 TaxID=768710 RepID=H5Y572_9FIRM|nr:phage putative head morphogenesis protein, SPP1 gp7 family [Desulfosporosinus youngiae DSM 17734]
MNDLQQSILDIRQSAENKANKDIKPILQAYKRSLNEIRTEIAKLYTKYAVDGTLQISKKDRYTFLKRLEKQLIEQAKAIGNIDLEHTTKILNEIYQDSYYQTAFAIESGVEVAIDFALLNSEMVETVVTASFEGATYSSRIWKNKELLVKSLRRQIENGIIQGHSIDKMSKVIKDQFGAGAYQSKRLINTEMARVVSQAQDQIYKDSSVVQKVMYDATLDNKTSDICRDLDGKTFDANSNYPKPPQHPNCRSAIIPMVDGWRPKTKRDNITKEIVPYQTYSEWQKKRGYK